MKYPRGISSPTARALFAVVLCVAVLLAVSCAYYNTLYNAKKRYAEVAKQPRGRESELTRQQVSGYDAVIEKCQTMIGTWPNSRHVDDAMLLIAQCLFQQDRYAECVVELDSLVIKHPKTNLMPQARLLKGKALARWGEHVEAVQVLEKFLEKYPRNKARPEALYYLATSSITLGREDAAVGYMNEMEKHYRDADITFEAQLDVANILSEKEHYDQARSVYEALNEERLPRAYRFGVWLGLSEACVQTGAYSEALDIVSEIEGMSLTTDQEPAALMVKARAYAGLDSTAAAAAVYLDIASRFTRGRYGAEARFHLGEIYEAADSLGKAKSNYDLVARSYARSEFAVEAVRRSGSISKLIRLQQMEDTDSPEAQALRDFSLAELQLTQFNESEQALATYTGLLEKFPDSEFAPKAAYAIGFIQGIVYGDTVRAMAARDLLLARYPDTEQAYFAYLFVPGLEGDGWEQYASAPPAVRARRDSLRALADTSAVRPQSHPGRVAPARPGASGPVTTRPTPTPPRPAPVAPTPAAPETTRVDPTSVGGGRN